VLLLLLALLCRPVCPRLEHPRLPPPQTQRRPHTASRSLALLPLLPPLLPLLPLRLLLPRRSP
jgi:hypothetical protein